MNLDVLAADIRKRGVISVWLCLEDQCAFAPVAPLSKEASTEVQSKLQRHVEARHAGDWIDLNPGQIVNSPVALAYECSDLADPDLSTVC